MQTTDSMNLKLFEDSDPVLPEDFNANTQAIEQALLCRPKVVTGTYAGTYAAGAGNNHPQTLTLPGKPILLLACGPTGNLLLIQGAALGFCLDSTGTVGACNVTWQGNSVSWLQGSDARDYGCNRNGNTYRYVALVQET